MGAGGITCSTVEQVARAVWEPKLTWGAYMWRQTICRLTSLPVQKHRNVCLDVPSESDTVYS